MHAFIYYTIWTLVILNSVAIAFSVDRPRQPITRPVAFISICINTLMLYGLAILYRAIP